MDTSKGGCDTVPQETGKPASANLCCKYMDGRRALRFREFRDQQCVFVPAKGNCYPKNYAAKMSWKAESCVGAMCGDNAGEQTRHMAEIGQSPGHFNSSG